LKKDTNILDDTKKEAKFATLLEAGWCLSSVGRAMD